MVRGLHAFPDELAAYARSRWPAQVPRLPDEGVLEEILSTAYHASLLREEERPVTFRLMVADPAEFSPADGPPAGLHRLVFDRPRAFTEHELRRLSPAAKYHRSLIGAHVGERGELSIWGLIQSGPRWMTSAQGGRATATPLPDLPIVRVTGPGRIAIACGSRSVAELRGGRLTDFALDVFESRWLPACFDVEREELARMHATAAQASGAPWPELHAEVAGVLAQQMFKRLLATIRSAHHGGAILVMPSDCADIVAEGRHVRLKYAFKDEEPRRRYRTLVLAALRALAEESAASHGALRWDDYRVSRSERLATVDEAIFEIAHLIAGLADVDGAVVLTKRFEMLGFGAEIAGDLPDVREVARALDLEANEREPEIVDLVGTRHRSAYRLCERFHDALAVVVSQDGGVRFIAWREGAVTYWDHASLGAGEA